MNRRIKSAIAVLGVLAITGTAYAVQQPATTGAEEPNPIIEQVGEHEVRIDSLEGRADETDGKVEQTAADVEVIQQTTGVAPAAGRTAPTPSPSNSAPAVAADPVTPAPAPEPAKNPRLIVAVRDAPTTPGMHSCKYTLHDPTQNVTSFIQPVENACYATGEVLPYV